MLVRTRIFRAREARPRKITSEAQNAKRFVQMTYITHDNGNRPFKVEIIKEELKVKVFKKSAVQPDNIRTEDEIVFDTQPIKTYKPNKVFIGKSPKNKMTKISHGYGKRFNGNSILLEMRNNKYIFIGSAIRSFNAIDKITKFISPVGNNDVPYPFAIDNRNNVYLLLEDVIISNVPKDDLKNVLKKPYIHYYSSCIITDIDTNDPNNVLGKFEDIEDYRIGQERYNLHYYPHAAREYARLSKIGIMYIKKVNEQWQRLSKDEYVALMRRFGESRNFTVLNIALKASP